MNYVDQIFPVFLCDKEYGTSGLVKLPALSFFQEKGYLILILCQRSQSVFVIS